MTGPDYLPHTYPQPEQPAAPEARTLPIVGRTPAPASFALLLAVLTVVLLVGGICGYFIGAHQQPTPAGPMCMAITR